MGLIELIIKVLARLCCFEETLGENLLSCLFYLLEITCIL